MTNLNLVHVAAEKEIFLALENKESEKFPGLSIPSLTDSIFNFFSEYDINGEKLINTDIDDHKILPFDELSVNSTVINENIVSKVMKLHLKYHSMSKYLEILRKKQATLDLQSKNIL
jgi:hypothetical protein